MVIPIFDRFRFDFGEKLRFRFDSILDIGLLYRPMPIRQSASPGGTACQFCLLAQPLLFNPGTPRACTVCEISMPACVRRPHERRGYMRGTRADNAVKLGRDSDSLSTPHHTVLL